MRDFRALTSWTVVTNFFIVIGAGHGIAFLGLIEIFWIPYINREDFSLSLTAPYDKSLYAAALFSFVGQVLLIISFFPKKGASKFWSKAIGLVLLWIGFYYLTHDLRFNNAAWLGFRFGLPFLICSIVLFIVVVRDRVINKRFSTL